jgi:transposase
VPFRASGQRITLPLLTFVYDLLALGQTLKAVFLITGLNRNVVKKIDRARLSGLYTEEGEDGELKLRKPKRQARYLGADEFKLHNCRRHTIVIIDLKMGHVLWLAYSRKKQVVYDLCDFVGEEWMSKVEAIACDMNADFERAFLKRHPRLDVVYDCFHLVKNFNEKVICKVRKDKQARLKDEGDADAARALKHSTYILMSCADTSKRKDQDARAGKVVLRGSALFGKQEATQKGASRQRYKDLIAQNELLAACDIAYEMFCRAYGYRQQKRMCDAMEQIVEVCRGTGDRHFAKVHQACGVAHGRHRGARQAPDHLRQGGRHQPDDQDAQEGGLRLP